MPERARCISPISSSLSTESCKQDTKARKLVVRVPALQCVLCSVSEIQSRPYNHRASAPGATFAPWMNSWMRVGGVVPAADGCAAGRDEWDGLLLTCPFSTPKYVVDREGILAIRWSSEREGGARRSGLFFATNLGTL